MDLKPVLVDEQSSAKSTVELLERETILGIDCEGVNLGLKGQVTLIQIVTSKEEIFLFDVLACPEIASILKPVLENPEILKIIHDCRGDRTNLLKDFGILLDPVFDTQIAYRYMNPRTDLRIGWNKLCQLLKAPSNPLKEAFHGIYRTNPNFWKKRPLTREMMIYASADVRHLHAFQTRLSKSIGTGQQKEFERLCREAILKEGEEHNFRF